jgi:uncharacterized membrane protein
MRLPLLILHILGGSIGLLSGTFAITVRKGSRLHRASGNVFTIAMLTLASSGLFLVILKSQTGNIIGSIITFYMISTAWLAGRRTNTGPPEWGALLVGIGGVAAILTLAIHSVRNPATAAPNAPAGWPSLWQPSSCSPPLGIFVCSLVASLPADSASRVTSGACVLDSSSQQALSSSASNRSFPPSCAAPSSSRSSPCCHSL